jgi:hypothetical protein
MERHKCGSCEQVSFSSGLTVFVFEFLLADICQGLETGVNPFIQLIVIDTLNIDSDRVAKSKINKWSNIAFNRLKKTRHSKKKY